MAYTQLGRQILSPHTAISFHVADPHFPGRKVSTLNILASTDFPQKLLQQLFFSRPEGRVYRRSPCSSANPEKNGFNATALFIFALHHFMENSSQNPEVHSSSEIQLNFLHNNFQFCHINVTRSSSFDLNPTPHKSKIPKLPSLPTSWSLSLPLL